MRVLFIGLGRMGLPMARRVELKLGQDSLIVFDIDPSRSADFAKRLDNLETIDVSTIVTMLPSDSALQRTLLDYNLFKKIPPQSTLLDFSTVSPCLSRSVCREASRHGHIFIDSPVSGGVNAAKDGTLTLLMGCQEQEIKSIKPLIDSVSKNQLYLGNRGNGCVAKICNNYVFMSNMIATCEAIAAAAKNGLDPKVFVDVLNGSSGQSWVSTKYAPIPVPDLPNAPCLGDFNSGFQSVLALKDLKLASDLLSQSGISVDFIDAVSKKYEKLVRDGLGSKDIGVYIREIFDYADSYRR